MTVIGLLNKINQLIINPLIKLGFAVALLVLFIGIVQFINSETSDSKRDLGKKKIIYGLVGIFVMVSAYGIISLLLNTFGITPPAYPFNSR